MSYKIESRGPNKAVCTSVLVPAGGVVVVFSVTEGMGSLPQQDTNPSAEAFVPRRLHPTMELL